VSRIWKRKCVIVVSALVMALTLGTVAWAAGPGEGGSTAASAAVTTATGSTATTVAAQNTPLRDLIRQRIERARLTEAGQSPRFESRAASLGSSSSG